MLEFTLNISSGYIARNVLKAAKGMLYVVIVSMEAKKEWLFSTFPPLTSLLTSGKLTVHDRKNAKRAKGTNTRKTSP